MNEKLFQAINEVMGKVGYVQKTGYMKNQNYTYAKEGEFIAAIRPAMVEAGLVMFPSGATNITSDIYHTTSGTAMNRVTGIFAFTLAHTSGESVTVTAIGEGADAGDKASYKAMTGAMKYALRQAFVIETGDDPDDTPSDDQHRAPAQTEKPAPAEKPAPQNPRPASQNHTAPRNYTAADVKLAYEKRTEPDRILANTGGTPPIASEKQIGLVASMMTQAAQKMVGPDATTKAVDAIRKAVLFWLAKIETTKDLTVAGAKAIIDWLYDGESGLTPDGANEFALCHRAAMEEQGQTDMFKSELTSSEILYGKADK
jgi:hypothetical protein